MEFVEQEGPDKGPILCISDLHGNLDLLRKAICRGLEIAQRSDLEIVLLGDLCDNGPDVPDLLEYLASEKWREEFPGIKLSSILGNHDMACLLSLDPSAFGANPRFRRHGLCWWERWTELFSNPGGVTAMQYGAATEEEFNAKFPVSHRNFLLSLPWYIKSDQYIFVHAGLRMVDEESVASQLQFLDRRDLSDLNRHKYSGGKYGIPDQLAHKGWCCSNDPRWEYVVVTGHNKYARFRDCEDFVASHRIGFHSCACAILFNHDLPLHCALLARGRKGSCVFDCPPVFYSVKYDDVET